MFPKRVSTLGIFRDVEISGRGWKACRSFLRMYYWNKQSVLSDSWMIIYDDWTDSSMKRGPYENYFMYRGQAG